MKLCVACLVPMTSSASSGVNASCCINLACPWSGLSIPYFNQVATHQDPDRFTKLKNLKLELEDMPVGVPFVVLTKELQILHMIKPTPTTFDFCTETDADIYNLGEYQVMKVDVLLWKVDVIDWFDDTSSATTAACTCDFYTVLLPFGCRCGGK